MLRWLILFLIVWPLCAQERPNVGLVLSGGGARGGAHLGALKVLEQYRIPIDAIVGTSMGSFVGGLYASGYTTAEIESILIDTEWTRYIAIDYDRQKIPFREKQLQRDFPGQLKIGVDQNNEPIVGTGFFKRQPMLQFLNEKLRHVSDVTDFDDLPIPFRSVATDFQTGATVSLGSGSLPRSIYASLSIPGVFYPIVIDGRTLVDGGVVDNLPLDVMRREMDADIIFVIDVSIPFEELPAAQSFLNVVVQLSNILVRKNTDETLAGLRDNEVLVIPELEGVTPLDNAKYPMIIRNGATAMSLFGGPNLQTLSQDEQTYDAFLETLRRSAVTSGPVIDRITLDNPTYIDDRAILERLRIRPGEAVDYAELDEDIAAIYNLTVFDDVTYEILKENGETVLHLSVTPSLDINGQLKFAFGFEDDFDGRSDYSVKFEYVMTGLNAYGGQWRNRAEVGVEKLLLSEVYQPLDPLQRFYVRPQLFYRDDKVYVSPNIFGEGEVQSELDQSVPLQAKEYGGLLGLGTNIGTCLQLEASVEMKEVKFSTDFLMITYDPVTFEPRISFVEVTGRQTIVDGHLAATYDALDNAFFPSKGIRAEAVYSRKLPAWGSEADYSQLYGALFGAWSFGRHTLLPMLKAGTTFDTDYFQTEDFNDIFTLGGLFNLSGLPNHALNGDHMEFGALLYRYRLSEKGFFGALEMPLYLGGSVETGDVWYSSGIEHQHRQYMAAGSIYVAADTILGPFYFAYGVADGRYQSAYLSLGITF